MTAVVVSLVAVVLLVVVVVAMGMRSMNRRESSLPPERLKEMAEKEERTKTRSTDEFAAHEPKLTKFSPDFSPIDEPKPKPVRTGQRGKRGVDEWGNPRSDEDDEQFWASIRSDAEEGGFGAGGTVAARKASSRPAEREQEPVSRDRSTDSARPAPRRTRPAADPNAATVQAPLPQRPAKSPNPAPAAASASGLADLVEPVQQRPAPSAAEVAEQRTVAFTTQSPAQSSAQTSAQSSAQTPAQTSDVMSILGAGAQPVPSPRPDPLTSGSLPAQPQGGSRPATPAAGAGSTPAANPASSGSFPAVPAAPINAAPTSDPFPAASPLDPSWPAQPAASTSGSWPATPSPDILDDPAPTASGSWPAFQQDQQQQPYRSSYEVSAGWAVADDSDPLTGSAPTGSAAARPAPAYDDILAAPTPTPAPAPTPAPPAYETGVFTAPPAPPAQPAWPAPPADAGYGGDTYGATDSRKRGGRRRTTPDQEFPDYYR